MGPADEAMVAAFADLQIGKAMRAGAEMGLPPSLVLTSLIQVAAGAMTQVSPSATAMFLRAYVEVIEAGPNAPPSVAAKCRTAFDEASARFASDVSAARDFPTPQGRA